MDEGGAFQFLIENIAQKEFFIGWLKNIFFAIYLFRLDFVILSSAGFWYLDMLFILSLYFSIRNKQVIDSRKVFQFAKALRVCINAF